MKSIRTYAFFALFAVGIAPLLVLALVLNAHLRRTAIQDAQEHLAVVTHEIGERLTEIMSGVYNELDALRFNPVLRNRDGSVRAWRSELDRLVRHFPDLHDLALYSADGTLITSASVEVEDPAPMREHSNWFFHTIAKGDVSVSCPSRQLGGKALFMIVYVPVQVDTQTGKPQGVIRATVRFGRIANILTGVNLGEAGQFILLDEAGLVLHHREADANLSRFAFADVWEQWKAEKSGRCQMNQANWLFAGSSLSAVETHAGANWHLVGLIAEDEVLDELASVREAALLVFVGTLVLVVGGGLCLVRKLCAPLAPLVQAAADVGCQRWDRVRLPLVGPLEIREVGRSFNRMAAAIQSYQDDLEGKVALRTKELKRKRSELTRANAQLAAALQSSLEGILAVGHDGKVLTMNRRFQEFFGIHGNLPESAALLDGVICSRVENPVGFQGFAEDLKDAESKLIDGRQESEWIVGFPSRRILRVYATPVLSPGGHSFGRLWVFADITETRERERGLQESQKLEAVGRLAGGIAHDFNNLLAGMIGNMSLLEPVVEGNAEAVDSLNAAQAAARRAVDLVRQILGVARKSFLRLASCQAEQIVEEVVSFVKHAFDPRITVSVVPPDRPCRIHVDPSQLHQVLMNLAVNARDALMDQHGGKLSFSLHPVELSEAEAEAIHPRLARPGRFIRIDVADTGGGIPPGVLERMFEPFFTTKAPGKGTGLGLATSAGIVEQHGGWMTCSTELGKGTTFHIFLPEEDAPPEEETIAAQTVVPVAPRRGTGETILLIDDEALVRTLNDQYLKRSGFRTLTATDGVEGLKCYQEHASQIDLVLLDMTMPNLSGPETFRQLRQWNADLPVIIYTGYVVDAEEFAADNGSMPSAILTKPLTLSSLGARIRDVLDDSGAELLQAA